MNKILNMFSNTNGRVVFSEAGTPPVGGVHVLFLGVFKDTPISVFSPDLFLHLLHVSSKEGEL